ncbi:MAG TPA: YaaL family protein [Candidatus Coprocola pullicola]|nr:YaaL family protein [Candidatus Coprocola pullicola]
MERLKHHLTEEGKEILEVIAEIQEKLEEARQQFDQATDDTLIDCYIYEMNALYKKYEYFLKIAKQLGLIAVGYEKIG